MLSLLKKKVKTDFPGTNFASVNKLVAGNTRVFPATVVGAVASSVAGRNLRPAKVKKSKNPVAGNTIVFPATVFDFFSPRNQLCVSQQVGSGEHYSVPRYRCCGCCIFGSRKIGGPQDLGHFFNALYFFLNRLYFFYISFT